MMQLNQKVSLVFGLLLWTLVGSLLAVRCWQPRWANHLGFVENWPQAYSSRVWPDRKLQLGANRTDQATKLRSSSLVRQRSDDAEALQSTWMVDCARVCALLWKSMAQPRWLLELTRAMFSMASPKVSLPKQIWSVTTPVVVWCTRSLNNLNLNWNANRCLTPTNPNQKHRDAPREPSRHLVCLDYNNRWHRLQKTKQKFVLNQSQTNRWRRVIEIRLLCRLIQVCWIAHRTS